MWTTFHIKLQSVSDVITNSSTEIYTVCTEYTLDRLKDIVNSILEISGSSLKADDLFTFELEEETTNYYYSDFCDRGYKVIPKKKKLILKLLNIYLI